MDLTKNEAKEIHPEEEQQLISKVLHLLGIQEILQPMVLTVHGNRGTVPIPVLTLEIMDQIAVQSRKIMDQITALIQVITAQIMVIMVPIPVEIQIREPVIRIMM